MLHSAYALAPSFLGIVYFYWLALDISYVSESDNTFLHGDKILYIHLAAYVLYACASFVAVLFLYYFQLVGDNFKHFSLVGKYGHILLYPAHKLGQLRLDFFPLQTGKLT